MAKGRKSRTTLSILPENLKELRALKMEMGFRTYTSLLHFMALEITRGGAIPPASYDLIFKNDRPGNEKPIILTGESGSGKTTTVRNLLSEFGRNVFILDVSNEYGERKDEETDKIIFEGLERLDLGKLFSMKWAKEGQRVRFVTDPNPDISKVEASTIFPRLAYEMHAGNLAGWLIVIEEGHRFGRDPGLRALLIEARKFCKLILVTTDWRLYEGTAKVFKPKPWASSP